MDVKILRNSNLAKKLLLSFIAVLSVFIVEAYGQTKPKTKVQAKTQNLSQAQGQNGIVEVDGAAVYQKSDFDSPVLNYLEKGTKVRISKKIYKGKDGFGAFYKVRLKDKRIGFIADVEVVPQLQADYQKSQSVEKQNPVFDKVEDMKNNPEPIIFTQYFGPTAGLVNYTQKFSGSAKSAFYPMYGLKYTGPRLLNGPPVDLDALFGIGVPSYYSSFSDQAKGFAWISSALLMFEIAEYAKSHLYYAFGPIVNFSSFQIKIGPQAFDSQELRMGLGFSLGYAYRISTNVLRVDFKYFVEKTAYPGFLFSYQW